MQAIELTLRFRLDCDVATDELFVIWDMLFQELQHRPSGMGTAAYLPLSLIAHGLAFCPDMDLHEDAPTLRLVDLVQRERRDATPRTARSEARTDRRRRRAA